MAKPSNRRTGQPKVGRVLTQFQQLSRPGPPLDATVSEIDQITWVQPGTSYWSVGVQIEREQRAVARQWHRELVRYEAFLERSIARIDIRRQTAVAALRPLMERIEGLLSGMRLTEATPLLADLHVGTQALLLDLAAERAARQKGRAEGTVNALTKLIRAYRKRYPDATPEDAREYFKSDDGETFGRYVIDEIKPERRRVLPVSGPPCRRRSGRTEIEDRVHWRRDSRTGKESEKKTGWSSIEKNWNTRYRPASRRGGRRDGNGAAKAALGRYTPSRLPSSARMVWRP